MPETKEEETDQKSSAEAQSKCRYGRRLGRSRLQTPEDAEVVEAPTPEQPVEN